MLFLLLTVIEQPHACVEEASLLLTILITLFIFIEIIYVLSGSSFCVTLSLLHLVHLRITAEHTEEEIIKINACTC